MFLKIAPFFWVYIYNFCFGINNNLQVVRETGKDNTSGSKGWKSNSSNEMLTLTMRLDLTWANLLMNETPSITNLVIFKNKKYKKWQ